MEFGEPTIVKNSSFFEIGILHIKLPLTLFFLRNLLENFVGTQKELEIILLQGGEK